MRQAECGVSIAKLGVVQGWRFYLPLEAMPL